MADTTLSQPLALRWSYQAKEGIGSSAAIVDGTVYVASMDGMLHAIDLATGKARWQYATGGSVEESSPAVRDGVVYVGDLDGTLHAVDAATGKARWTFKTEGEIRSSPNWLGDRIYVGSYDQHLYCLSAATGALVWKFQTDGPVHSTPAIDKDTVYVSGCDEQLRGIDAATGKLRFILPLGGYTGASVAVRDGQAYVGTFANEVLGIDLVKRAIRWTYKHPTRNFPFYASAAVVGRPRRAGRTRQAGALPVRVHRQGAVVVHDARPRRIVAAHRRQPRVRRVERRAAVRAGPGDGQEGVGVHGRRAAVGVARGGRRGAGDRLAGRRAVHCFR